MRLSLAHCATVLQRSPSVEWYGCPGVGHAAGLWDAGGVVVCRVRHRPR